MLAVAFGLFVLGSLLVSGLLFFEVLPASPAVLGVIGGVHALFGFAFLRAYLRYRAVHRLVHEGQGELFELASAHRIARERFRGLRAHFRLRRVEGLALAGLGREALAAAEELRAHVDSKGTFRLDALAAEAEANLLMDRPWWAEQVLAEADEEQAAARHPGLVAVRSRLAWLRGDPDTASEGLSGVRRAGSFPLTAAVRARNLCWYAQALRDAGRREEAGCAFRRAARTAPRSYWGRLAAREGRP
ncbi:MAG: hypothetical protein ACQEXJ_08395 [Myxococcota bacterium]